MTYSVKVNVSFDPRFMCKHKWVAETWGLGALMGQYHCSRCGEWEIRPNDMPGGIDRSRRAFWSNRDD
jgi:hypothetical protein